MNESGKLAITFEAAGNPAPTGPILKALKGAQVRATFFLDGRWAQAQPDLLKQIVAEGHELGNHGYRHPDWTELSDEQIEEDLIATEKLIERLVGADVKPWARPPYGAIDPRVLQVLESCGYHAVYRDAVDGGHWPGETNRDSIHQRALYSASDGAVIVFHTNRQETAEALPRLLADLRKAGFTLGTLSDLGTVPSPRLEYHPDFYELDVQPGYIRPRGPGRWQSLNLLDMGALAKKPANFTELVAELNDSALDLITGSGDHPLAWEEALSDVYVQVLAGAVRCDFAEPGGEDLGYLIARKGDFFRCPQGTRYRLGPDTGEGRRWIALMWRPNITDGPQPV